MGSPKGQPESSISDEAYTLLDSIVSGLDDAVYDLALEIARQRRKDDEGAPILIEVEDVENAGTVVADALKSLPILTPVHH